MARIVADVTRACDTRARLTLRGRAAQHDADVRDLTESDRP
jgi:hypothetical protein